MHFRESPTEQYDSDIVIESLLEDIDTRIKKDELKPDFIAFTGDLAFSGKPSEYDLARDFFNELLKISGVERERLFMTWIEISASKVLSQSAKC
jgi:3',5'-cyclic AMP phosphodiesterase CpdA